MAPYALVVDSAALQLLQGLEEPSEEWFRSFQVNDSGGRLRSTIADGIAIIASADADQGSRLLVVKLGNPSLFNRFTRGQSKEVFRRMQIAGLSVFQPSIEIPRNWKPFNLGSRISIHCLSEAMSRQDQGAVGRLEVDRNPFGQRHVYVYNCSESAFNDMTKSVPDRATFERAVLTFAQVLQEGPKAFEQKPDDLSRIELAETSFFRSQEGISHSEWIAARLTEQQRQFVEEDNVFPIRLMGAAGTGKTLALCIKALRLMQREVSSGRTPRVLFLTHSEATCEATSEIIRSLDAESVLAQVHGAGGVWRISTLLSLALDAVGGKLAEMKILPLATDALEGRRLQLELIESTVDGLRKSGNWLVMRGRCSEQFRAFIESANRPDERRRVAWELMNEYACVLDASGASRKLAERQKYITELRMQWMLPLPAEGDREVVLDLYSEFNRLMTEMSAISVDQLIADYLNYLDSFGWNAVREKLGYDAIFIDELHLFNRQERMTFHALTATEQQAPRLFMAYDPKQSPADTFAPIDARETPTAFWQRLKLGTIQKYELDTVFRYTPQIAQFVASIDDAFPALDLGEEWGKYNLSSAVPDAAIPTSCEMESDIELYRFVFARAKEIKRRGGRDYRIAVLCCNADQFATYKSAGQHAKDVVSVSSREEAGSVRPDAFRFVVSIPEYVAGLQFDTVLLVDVNDLEVPEGPYSAGPRRRFLSVIYLGASRASRHLELYSSKRRGGLARMLSGAVAKGVLKPVSTRELPDGHDVVRA